MSKKTVLEFASFHISNGGMTVKIVEREDKRENCTVLPDDWHEGAKTGKYKYTGLDGVHDPAITYRTHYNRKWYCEVGMTCFGSGTTFRFPLVPRIVKWSIEALNRTLVRMETPTGKFTDGEEYAFKEGREYYVYAEGGEKVDKTVPPRDPKWNQMQSQKMEDSDSESAPTENTPQGNDSNE